MFTSRLLHSRARVHTRVGDGRGGGASERTPCLAFSGNPSRRSNSSLSDFLPERFLGQVGPRRGGGSHADRGCHYINERVACDAQRAPSHAIDWGSCSAREGSTCRGERDTHTDGGERARALSGCPRPHAAAEMERLCGPELPFWVSTFPCLSSVNRD